MLDEKNYPQDDEASVSTNETPIDAGASVQDNHTDINTDNTEKTNETTSGTTNNVHNNIPNFNTANGFGGTTPPPINPMFQNVPPTYNSYQFGQQPVFNRTPVTPPPKKDKSGKTPFWKKALLIAGLGIIFGLFSGTVFCGVTKLASTFDNSNEEKREKLENKTDEKETVVSSTKLETATDISTVVKKVMPSVVSISTVSVTEYPTFFGYSIPQESQSSGSGVIVGTNETELLIVTNNHVIAGATSLTVAFSDNEIASAQIKGTDSNMDLAIIAVKLSDIKDSTMDAIAIAEIGDSDALCVGEPAIAIGNALGYGQSVTTGIISALNREVTVDNITNSLIQTDAAINPGNSGGALLNIKGELIGINSVKYSSTEVEGMGYAIPISSAMPIIEKLMVRETKEKASESGYLGIAGTDVDASVSKIYSLPMGVYVSEVLDGYGAKDAGIKKGDIITEVEGTSISSMDDLTKELSYYEPGEKIKVVIQTQSNKGYVEKELEVTLSKKPSK